MLQTAAAAASLPGGGGHPQKGALQRSRHTFCVGIAPATTVKSPDHQLQYNFCWLRRNGSGQEGRIRECVHFKCDRSLFPHTPENIFFSKYFPANSFASSLNLKLPLPLNALNESAFTVNAWIQENLKSPFLGCEIAPSLGVEQFTSADLSVLLESAPVQRRLDGWASRSWRTPIPRKALPGVHA